MLILAIDPGTTQSAWVAYCPELQSVEVMGLEDNETLLASIRNIAPGHYDALAIENIVAMGMTIGQSTLETMFWVGRFFEAFDKHYSQAGHAHRISRRDIKLHLCGTCRAKDKNVRQALIDYFPPWGGGKTPQVGTKACNGPLYGIKSHLWSALAVAVTWSEKQGEKENDNEYDRKRNGESAERFPD